MIKDPTLNKKSIQIKRALLSVFDKEGIIELAQVLVTKNIEILSISNLLGEAIKRISNSTSVSDLFK